MEKKSWSSSPLLNLSFQRLRKTEPWSMDIARGPLFPLGWPLPFLLVHNPPGAPTPNWSLPLLLLLCYHPEYAPPSSPLAKMINFCPVSILTLAFWIQQSCLCQATCVELNSSLSMRFYTIIPEDFGWWKMVVGRQCCRISFQEYSGN